MNYGIGDIVVKKGNKHDKYLFLGTTEDKSLRIVGQVKSVMGNEIEIGMYIHTPVRVEADGIGDYVTKIIFAHVGLFENDRKTDVIVQE